MLKNKYIFFLYFNHSIFATLLGKLKWKPTFLLFSIFYVLYFLMHEKCAKKSIFVLQIDLTIIHHLIE